MAAGPIFNIVGALAASSGATTLSPALPIGPTRGKLFLVVTVASNATVSVATGGWSLVRQTNSGAAFTVAIFHAAVGAVAPVPTWTGAALCSAQVALYDDPNNPLDQTLGALGTASTGAAATHTSTSLTTTRANSRVILIDATASAASGAAAPSGYSLDSDQNASYYPNGATIAFASVAVAASGGSSGAASTTASVGAWVQQQIELRIVAPINNQTSGVETGGELTPGQRVSVASFESGAAVSPRVGNTAVAGLESGAAVSPRVANTAVAGVEAGGFFLYSIAIASSGPTIALDSLSALTPFVGSAGSANLFDFGPTVISQYANSPIMLGLLTGFTSALDPSPKFDDFYAKVWNVDTAQGYGLDVWGRIVGVNRVLQVPASGTFFGFAEASAAGWNQAVFYGGNLLTSNYFLTDYSYRRLILAKALANISDGSIASINQVLISLFSSFGNCYVVDNGDMTITYRFATTLDPVNYAIVSQSGVLPRPAGVSYSIVQG